MPKNIFLESATHQILTAAKRLRGSPEFSVISDSHWNDFINSWIFEMTPPKQFKVEWTFPQPGQHEIMLAPVKFYSRGEHGLSDNGDSAMSANAAFFDSEVRAILSKAALPREQGGPKTYEEHFHDAWAASENLTSISARKAMEAATSPEMRYLRRTLGNLQGKKLLDLGSGLGEASIYFALEGAEVTAVDISSKMLEAVGALAKRVNVQVATVKSDISELKNKALGPFDVIYAGNLLHHVDIDDALAAVATLLSPGGVFVSWDPIAYNPIINVYRKMATSVRTPDEHPLTFRDIRTFRRRFAQVDLRAFWLTTLVIFIIMAVFERRNPNQERFWKKVVDESDRWEWLYLPLEKLDTFLLKICPALRWLCWNMVVVARQPILGANPDVKS